MERFDLIRTSKVGNEDEVSLQLALNLDFERAAKWLKKRFKEECNVPENEEIRFKWLAPLDIEFYLVVVNKETGVQREVRGKLVEV